MIDGGVYKTRKFTNPQYIGDPINIIKIFNDKEVDELILLDIKVSKFNLEPNFNLIEKIAGECFMPLCYGGGIRNIDQASKLFSLGIEKISIQTQAFVNIDLISQVAKIYGSQSVAISIDVKRNIFGKIMMYETSSRKFSKRNLDEFIDQCIDSGVGEIILNSIDDEGTMEGMNLDLIANYAKKIKVPLIVGGGVGSMKDIEYAIEAGASGVSVGSFFIFYGKLRGILISYNNNINKNIRHEM
jgi:cyclase